MGRDLEFSLDLPLPGEVAVGRGTALVVCGWCVAEDVRALELLVDGQPQPTMGHAMPRRDVFELHDAEPGSFRSGFWGVVRLTPSGAGAEHTLDLRATFRDGSHTQARLASVTEVDLATPVGPREVVPREQLEAAPAQQRAGTPPGDPLVAICMATYEPPTALLKRQLDSIRAQTHGNWVCVISDDCSTDERFEALRAEVGDDPRFVLSRSPRRLGFYANFERALSLAPTHADYVAMADQDDYWYPDKLATLLDQLGDAKLVYSDARIVSPSGEEVAPSYWGARQNNHSDLLSLLCANSVTGAASLFGRDLLDTALPFPPPQFAHFHDHWIGLVALSLGEIAYVDRPLYDYVQHGAAVLGHAEANRMPSLKDRLGALRRPVRERVRRWRLTYFVDCLRLIQFATVLDQRCGARMSAPKRRVLERFLRADRSSLELARFGMRAGRELTRAKPETLGAELGLMFGFGWRRLAQASARGADRPRPGVNVDARPPTRLVQRPGRVGPDDTRVRVVAEKIAPLDLAPADDAPRRVNLLIPTIDLDHFFGGYIGKLNLARRLAQRGERVRLVTVDPVDPLPGDWKQRLERYSGLDGVFDQVEVAFGREAVGLEVSREDRFVASTWWTAHVAKRALDALGGGRFLYLIQEYEPFTFPMSTYAALAGESYTFPHTALFSTELLRDYFRRHQLGVYADGADGDARSASFQNAITKVEPPSATELSARASRRLLFYARPEPHAARNLFELGMLALSRALERGAFGPEWELHGIGTVDAQRRLSLGGGAFLELLPRSGQGSYAELLPRYDAGMALMYTPHPSLVPIEMASAGMVTVTTSFENKTPAAMAEISSNLLTVAPTIEGVAAGLAEAAARVEDVDARLAGARVNWSRDWDVSLDDTLMERVQALLASD